MRSVWIYREIPRNFRPRNICRCSCGRNFQFVIGQDHLEALCARALVACFEKVDSFKQANLLMGRLNRLKRADASLIERLQRAPTVNDQVEGAFQVGRDLPSLISRLKKGTK